MLFKMHKSIDLTVGPSQSAAEGQASPSCLCSLCGASWWWMSSKRGLITWSRWSRASSSLQSWEIVCVQCEGWSACVSMCLCKAFCKLGSTHRWRPSAKCPGWILRSETDPTVAFVCKSHPHQTLACRARAECQKRHWAPKLSPLFRER